MSNINIKFGQKNIQFPPNIHFDSGKIYQILGKNGSGKSTLLKIIIGDLKQFTGDYYIKGNKAFDIQLLDKIAYVNQNPSIFNETVRENIDIILD